jgi:hypothetical protein
MARVWLRSRQRVADDAQVSAGECALCTWLITKADALLEEPVTDENVVKALETVCDVLPDGDLRITVRTCGAMAWKKCRETDGCWAQCKSLVEAVGPDVINLIASHADPAKICHELRAC